MRALGRLLDFFRSMLGGPPTGSAVGGPPVHAGDFADPFVLRAGGRYLAYATQAGPVNVQCLTSTDLVEWRPLGDVLPELPSWAAPGRTWSPVVLDREDRFLLYYAVREPRADRQAISVAAAARPEGPFVDTSTAPLVYQLERGGSIDPSPFVDDDGAAYLVWKSDDNAVNRPSSLWLQRLSDDGLTLVGERTELLSHDRGWERPLIEAPSIVRADGRYFLFYSANWWESPYYSVGYAVADSVTGPFTKVTRRKPWFGAAGAVAGPGGQEFFTDADGRLRMAYHAWSPGLVGYANTGARSLRIATVDFVDGRPHARHDPRDDV